MMMKSGLMLMGAALLFVLNSGPQFAGQSRSASISRYDFSIKILPAARRLEIAGEWRMPAAATQKREIEFYLSPRMRDFKVEIADPVTPSSLSSAEESGDTKWTIKVERPIPAQRAVTLKFSYHSASEPAPQFIISPEGTFAGSGGELWYPQTSFSEREAGTLRFFVPAGETVIANGVLRSASARQQSGEFVFEVDSPSKFAFACGKYTVLRRPGKPGLSLYLLKPRKQADEIISGSKKALDFLTRLYGPLPYRELSLVEVDFRSAVTGTGEYGFILADDSEFDKQFNLAYWAHELGHQWWGNLIKTASGTTGRMMMSEGLAQFGALQAIEAIEGEKAAEQFQRSGYPGYRPRQSAAGYLELALKGDDLPLATHAPKNQHETVLLHSLVNSKGFIVLDMLARQLGREKFAAILGSFIEQNRNHPTSWAEFERAIEARAGQDLHWFFEQWCERTGAPDYRLTWEQQQRSVTVTINQPASAYRATLEIELRGGQRRLLKTVTVTSTQASFNWPIPFKVESVELDPHYKVLRKL